LDQKDQVADECFAFIEEAILKGDSVLVHSVKGQSRACTVLATYVMRKYRWALLKTLEFLNSRRPDLEIKAAFIHQLTAFENRLIGRNLGPKTSKWTEVFDKTINDFENEELLLRNTYLNAQMGPFADFSAAGAKPNEKPPKIKWVDETTKNQKNLATLIEFKDTENSPEKQPEPQLLPTQAAPPEEKKPSMIVLTKNKAPPASRNSKNPGETVPVSAKPLIDPNESKNKTEPQIISARGENKTELNPKNNIQPPHEVKSQNFMLNTENKRKDDSEQVKKPVNITPELPHTHSNRPLTHTKKDNNSNKNEAEKHDSVPAHLNSKKEHEAKKPEKKDEAIRALLVPKYNNFVGEEIKPDETAKKHKKQKKEHEKDKEIEKSQPKKENEQKTITQTGKNGVTQIINQNNINNYIINNPQKIELIEFSPAKAQLIPELKPSTMMRLHQTASANNNVPISIPIPTNNANNAGQAPPSQSTIKKIVNAKKVSSQPRCSSAAVRRESPKLTETRDKTRTKERPKPMATNNMNAILEKSLKGSLVGPIIKHQLHTNPNALSQVRGGPIKAGLKTIGAKAPAPKGEQIEQPLPVKIAHKVEHVELRPRSEKGVKKQRPPSPGVFLRTVNASGTVKSIPLAPGKKPSMRSISPRQVVKPVTSSQPILTRGMSPGKNKWKA